LIVGAEMPMKPKERRGKLETLRFMKKDEKIYNDGTSVAIFYSREL